MENKIIVAIDGYSSCGKSTIAKALAKYAGYTYVDTGAMYRATALYAQRMELGENMTQIIPLLDKIQVSFVQTSAGQHVTLNGEDVESQIRTLEIGNMASQISTIKEVRAFLVAQQQMMGKEKGIVMDGRDIGTVVLPDADVKIFLTASNECRAMRRYEELKAKGIETDYQSVLADMIQRDENDRNREVAPAVAAADAVTVDNSGMSPDECSEAIMKLIQAKIAK